jgi:hypothetical protein
MKSRKVKGLTREHTYSWTGGQAQVVEHLPNKCKPLNSSSSKYPTHSTKQQNKTKKTYTLILAGETRILIS